MAVLSKKQMSEEDIKLNFITPAIQPNWQGHITMETKITDGRINIKGNIVARSKPKFADYMLYLNDGKPIAVVEAKDNNHSVSHGLQQAMTYAQMMDLPFAYASNGDAFYEHDFLTGKETLIELDKFPSQEELIARYYAELNGVVSLIEKLSLSHPNISFKLSSDNKELIKTSGSNDLLKTIYEIYGYNVSKNMVYIEGHNDDYDINGYVSNINITKSTKKDMITLVNGRIVNNSYVNRIIKDAYHTYLAVDKYPIVVINILVDPTIVDVNIHPTKQDIKFGKMETLEELLFSLIRDKLMNINNMFKAYDETKYEVSNSEEYVLNDNLVVKEEYDKPVIEESKMCFNMNEESSGYETVIDTLEVKNEKPSLLHPIGLAMGTYLFATDEECVYMIDIHAANERINYEKLLNALKESVVHKTSMLFPITIEFTKNEFMTIMEKKEFITNLGISFDEFGVNTIRVYEHPTYFREGYEEESLRRVFDLIVSIDKDFDRVKFNEQLAINLSCKMSVKANTFIGSLEQETLLKRLFECEFPYTCPHGRPTIIKYTKYELEKLFKRVNG